jgi:hypothetical protein
MRSIGVYFENLLIQRMNRNRLEPNPGTKSIVQSLHAFEVPSAIIARHNVVPLAILV